MKFLLGTNHCKYKVIVFFLEDAITKVYIAGNAFTSPRASKLILLKDTKNYKLAKAQTCNFLNVSSPKLS